MEFSYNKSSHRLAVFAVTVVFAGTVLCATATENSSSASAFSQRDGRISPPPTLPCDRNNTTSFTGRITAYRRTRGRVFVRVRTDEETTETFTLHHAANTNAASLFLIHGEKFGAGDWNRVEVRRGKLRRGMRATIWACYEGDQPRAKLIDWRPIEN